MTGHQRGAALLVALAAVTLAAVLAVSMLERGRSGLARTAALADAERAWQYAGGMEILAREWLAQARRAGVADSRLSGRWSDPFPIPGGQVRGRLLDRSGRFNVNALADPDPEAAAQARAALQVLLENPGADWVASVSRRLRPPDGPALLLAHPAELERLAETDANLRAQLRMQATVLPDPASRININTTTPEVLAAWIPGLTVADARRVLAERPYPDLETAAAHPVLRNLASGVLFQRFSVTSHWHLAQARVTLDGVDRDFYRLMRSGGGGYDFRYFSQGTP